MNTDNNIILIDGKPYREVIEHIGKFEITHQIPIMNKKEKEEEEEKKIINKIYTQIVNSM